MRTLAIFWSGFLLFAVFVSPSRACQFDPPGMSHQAWVDGVNQRNAQNDAKAKAAAEGNTPATAAQSPGAEVKRDLGLPVRSRASSPTARGRRSTASDDGTTYRPIREVR